MDRMNRKRKEQERPAQRWDDTYVFKFSDFALACFAWLVALKFGIGKRVRCLHLSLYISYLTPDLRPELKGGDKDLDQA
jgi:hypothetical protein